MNFSPSRGPLELIARRMVHALENGREDTARIGEYADCNSEKYRQMVEMIRRDMGFTTLKYLTLEDMIQAIGVPPEGLCTYCWTGKD